MAGSKASRTCNALDAFAPGASRRPEPRGADTAAGLNQPPRLLPGRPMLPARLARSDPARLPPRDELPASAPFAERRAGTPGCRAGCFFPSRNRQRRLNICRKCCYCKGKRHPRVCLISVYLRRHGGKINALGSKQLSAAELGAQRCRQRGADECLLGLTRAPRPAPAQGGKVTVRQGQDTRLERLSWDHQNSTGRGEKTQPPGEMGNGFPAGPADRRCRTPHLPTPRGLACATRRLSGLHRHGPGRTGAPEPVGPGPGGPKQAGVPCCPSSPPSPGPSLPPSSPPPSSPLIPTSPCAAEGDSPASPCQTTKRTRALASPHPKSCPGREGHRRLAAARRDAGEMHRRPELRLGSPALIDCD
ncbi:uncharacterized protein LOC135318219 isoform X2 [Phalacrocorax carbo]|uniref:uncharacterized protein LOC135318219 isoform X2 n=1 Tax=Phalacrocorax carbo TaxID=9209 RepID=UPI0031194276